MAIDDPNFGTYPHVLPNFAADCGKCGRPIPFFRPLPFLPESSGVEETISLKCPRPECNWVGTVRAPAVYPYTPPDEANL